MTTRRIGLALLAVAFLGLAGSAAAQLKNTKIAFARDDDIWVMGYDGSNHVNLTNDADLQSAPAWSPDGAKIAYGINNGVASDIFVMNADGSGAVNLTNLPTTSDGNPDWSPDGSLIAFVSTRDGDAEIYVMSADGTGPTRLTTSPGGDQTPDWSPDGSQIVFQSSRVGSKEDVYVMNADGSGQTILTSAPGDNSTPEWSPDGSKIVFQSSTAGNWDIYVMNADGSSPTAVLVDPAAQLRPSWSPDGAEIAFRGDQDGNAEIYTIGSDGTGLTRLTTAAGVDDEPAWSTYLPTDTTVTVLDAQGLAGSPVTLPVQITDTTGLVVTGVSLGITYDAALLTPTGAAPAAVGALVPAGWSLEQNSPSAGLLQVSLAGGFGDPLVGAGVLVNVTFDVAAAATAGSTSAVTLTQADLNEGAVSSAHVAGTFTVLSLTYGDVTGNGAVTSFDASWVLEYVVTNAVGTPVTFPVETSAPTWASSPLSNADAIAVADVNGDAAVGAIDASLILQHDVEIITQFPVETRLGRVRRRLQARTACRGSRRQRGRARASS